MYCCSSLVPWDKFCTPKNSGGLGVKDLEIQNACLLMKSAFKFLHSTDITWRNWLIYGSPYPIQQTQNTSYLPKVIKKQLVTLRLISQCQIGNGQSTYFR
jgi:hypothetical protein